jgi:GMP synthase-like glutamine amidotransferase
VFTGYDELASFSLGPEPSRRGYDAVMIFGGESNVDDDHDWLAREKEQIGHWLSRGTPLLGVCLGAQLIAELAGARVGPLERPEIGWHELDGVGLAFEWHHYGFASPPPGATELARNAAGCQAFRIGNATGIQYHAEVDEQTVNGWIRDYGPEAGIDAAALAAQTGGEIGRWNEYGRALCARFLATAR